MKPTDCPQAPQPDEQHEITEEEVRKLELFELETVERTLLSGPTSRLRNLMTPIERPPIS